MGLPDRLGALWDKTSPDMKLTKSYFREVASYEKEYPGVVGAFIEKLEYYGCSHALEYFRAAGYPGETDQQSKTV